MGKLKKTVASIGFVGFLAGGLVGFLLRPSAFIIGQLPFRHVISRGESLQGVEKVFVSLARESFNTMLTGAVIGWMAGIIIGYFVGRSK